MKLLDINISDMNYAETASKIKDYLKDDRNRAVYKINTEFLNRALQEKKFFDILNRSDLNIADGRGVLWAAKYLSLPISDSRPVSVIQAIWQMMLSGAAIVLNPRYITSPIPENIPGVEALRLMLKAAEETDSGVFLFGATKEDLEGSIREIKKEFRTIKIVGSLDGYSFQSDESISPVDLINRTDARLLVVALGSPLQEYWIQENLGKLKNVRIAVGEGGSLAKIAGSQKLVPKWLSRIGLEWFWRLFTAKSMTHQTGGRLKRVWNAVPGFILRVIKYKIVNGASVMDKNNKGENK